MRTTTSRTSHGHLLRSALFLAAMVCAPGLAPTAQAQDAAGLRARHVALRSTMASSAFGQPLVMESSQASNSLTGDVYAVVAQPFSTVGAALQRADHWCNILILHLNVKRCVVGGSAPGTVLSVAVGRKFDQPIADAYSVEFAYRMVTAEADYLKVQLNADVGPLGTKDYRILVEATPIDAKSSFVHMSYSYGYGMAAGLALQAYLVTAGKSKVGFSITGTDASGGPVYVGNVRGMVERNTMRYFLAIESYLNASAVPAAQRDEQRLQNWFSAIERYPRQLHELERDEYISMKRRELAAQRAAQSGPPS